MMFCNTLRTTVLLAGLGGLMVAIGSLFGRGGAVIGLALAMAMVGFSYWKSALPSAPPVRAPLASALEKLEVYAHRVPMTIQPAQAQAFHRQPAHRAQGQLRQPVPHPPHDRRAGPPPARCRMTPMPAARPTPRRRCSR